MIIGNGDIAKALKLVDRDDLLFFASGVSNSQEMREAEYDREEYLLFRQPKDAHLVYFSSLSIFYNESRYVTHKMRMEKIIADRFSKFTIVRLGNITWGDNPNTIINFLRNKIKNNEEFEVRDEYRYIIDKEEFLHWMRLIPEWNCEMNITGKRMKVIDIVNEYGFLDIDLEVN